MIEAIALGITAAILWGTGDFISRKASSEIGYYLTSVYMQLLSFVGLSAYLTLTQPWGNIEVSKNWELLAVNILIGVFSFVAYFFLYRGYATGIMSIVSPIAASYPLITVILAIAILGEIITPLKAFGIGMIVIGGALTGIKFSLAQRNNSNPRSVFPKKRSSENSKNHLTSVGSGQNKSRIKVYEGASSALVSCVSFGLMFFMLGLVTPVFGFVFPVAVLKGSATIFSLVLIRPLGQAFRIPSLRVLPWLAALGAVDSLGYVSANLGILSAGNSLPIVATLSSLLSPVTIALARVFYKEKLSGIQVFGILLLLIGVSELVYLQ